MVAVHNALNCAHTAVFIGHRENQRELCGTGFCKYVIAPEIFGQNRVETVHFLNEGRGDLLGLCTVRECQQHKKTLALGAAYGALI